MLDLNEIKQSFIRLIPNKLLNRSPNFVEKFYFLSIMKYLCYQYGVT